MQPLSFRLRPTTFEEVYNQDHLVGENGVIKKMLENNKLFSMILYGPPGIGKTTIAEIIGEKQERPVFHFNASTDKKAVLQNIAKYPETFVIIDEIHRMNKDIQDFLLPYLENGSMIIVGLTTISPYHSVNPAIRSRLHIYKLNDFNSKEIAEIIATTANKLDLKLSEEIISYISDCAGKELRTALNMLEMVTMASNTPTIEEVKELIQQPQINLDKNADSYFELLSGLQKSIRGSDVNAALHYLAKLLILEDLISITRRLRVIVYEDIGLANPDLQVRVNVACDAALSLGLPEARIPLGNIVVDMALSPKSNSTYLAIDKAIDDIKGGNTGPLPINLKNPKLYKYPHNEPHALLKQQYLPDGVKADYYDPKETGKYEKALKERLKVINNFNKK